MAEHYCIKFGDPSCSGIWDTVWTDRQTDRQTPLQTLPTRLPMEWVMRSTAGVCGQCSQPVSNAEDRPGAIVEVLPVPAGQRGGRDMAAGTNQSGQVSGRRQRPHHVPDAHQTTWGNWLTGCVAASVSWWFDLSAYYLINKSILLSLFLSRLCRLHAEKPTFPPLVEFFCFWQNLFTLRAFSCYPAQNSQNFDFFGISLCWHKSYSLLACRVM